MSCKLTKVLLVLCACGIVFQTSEAIIYTLGGLVLDSALACLIFGKWLALPLLVGKRSIESPVHQIPSFGQPATAEQYLSVAASIDTNKCLPVVVCAAMARSKDVNVKLSEFDSLIVETFQGKMEETQAEIPTPIDYYREAAKFGHTIGAADQCRLISPKCNYSIDELQKITHAVSQYQL
ncbi:hypothetical protein CHUAL_010892 [Chamberlinius hualienensis]